MFHAAPVERFSLSDVEMDLNYVQDDFLKQCITNMDCNNQLKGMESAYS